MVDQNLHENISIFMLRQIAIVRQMVYNMLSIFDVTKNLAMGSTGSTSLLFPFVAILAVPKSMAIPCGWPVLALMECELWITFRLQKQQKNGESQDVEYKYSARKEESKGLSV